jgi:hypothetical protein
MARIDFKLMVLCIEGQNILTADYIIICIYLTHKFDIIAP